MSRLIGVTIIFAILLFCGRVGWASRCSIRPIEPAPLISASLEKATMSEFLSEWCPMMGYVHFGIREGDAEDIPTISIDLKGVPPLTLLHEVLALAECDYRVSGRSLVVFKKRG